MSPLYPDHGLQLVREILLDKYYQPPYPEGIDCSLIRLWLCSLGMASCPSFPMTLGKGRPFFSYHSPWPQVLRALENLPFFILEQSSQADSWGELGPQQSFHILNNLHLS